MKSTQLMHNYESDQLISMHNQGRDGDYLVITTLGIAYTNH